MNQRISRTIVCLLLLGAAGMLLPGCRVVKIGVTVPPGWTTIRPIDGILSMTIQGDTVWVGSKDGLFKVDRPSGAIVEQVKTDPPLTYVKALMVDKNGLLYIGHFNGVTVYDGETFRTYTTKDGLPDNRINALLQTGDGKIWVGSWGGATVLADGKFNTLTKADGLADDMVNVMTQDRSGGIWFGSLVAPAGGISYLKDGHFQLFSTENGLPHDDVTSIFEDRDGSVWAGTGLLYRGGTVEFVPAANGWTINRTLNKSDGLAGEKVRSIFQDKDGTMWFGSEYDGMASYNRGTWKIFNERNGLSGAEVTCVLQEADGTLWFGTSNGITRLSYAAVQTATKN